MVYFCTVRTGPSRFLRTSGHHWFILHLRFVMQGTIALVIVLYNVPGEYFYNFSRHNIIANSLFPSMLVGAKTSTDVCIAINSRPADLVVLQYKPFSLLTFLHTSFPVVFYMICYSVYLRKDERKNLDRRRLHHYRIAVYEFSLQS